MERPALSRQLGVRIAVLSSARRPVRAQPVACDASLAALSPSSVAELLPRALPRRPVRDVPRGTSIRTRVAAIASRLGCRAHGGERTVFYWARSVLAGPWVDSPAGDAIDSRRGDSVAAHGGGSSHRQGPSRPPRLHGSPGGRVRSTTFHVKPQGTVGQPLGVPCRGGNSRELVHRLPGVRWR